MNVHHSSKSNEHYTPDNIIKLVVDVLGVIDLDPCSDLAGNVPASTRFTKNGLTKVWTGRVFMNPPYSELTAWANKLVSEENVSDYIALVPARPGKGWWATLSKDCTCMGLLHSRLKFKGNDNSAPFPSALFYRGDSNAFETLLNLEGGITWEVKKHL